MAAREALHTPGCGVVRDRVVIGCDGIAVGVRRWAEVRRNTLESDKRPAVGFDWGLQAGDRMRGERAQISVDRRQPRKPEKLMADHPQLMP